MSQQAPEQGGTIVLPFSKEDFGSFVSGLLGKPQVIESLVPGVFTLTRDDVVNAFHLVNLTRESSSRTTAYSFNSR